METNKPPYHKYNDIQVVDSANVSGYLNNGFEIINEFYEDDIICDSINVFDNNNCMHYNTISKAYRRKKFMIGKHKAKEILYDDK